MSSLAPPARAGVRAHFSDIIPNASIGKQSPVNDKLDIARGLLRGSSATNNIIVILSSDAAEGGINKSRNDMPRMIDSMYQ
jgi:hypothetical protein